MRVLLCVYKILLCALVFFIKAGLAFINFFILNILIDNFKK